MFNCLPAQASLHLLYIVRPKQHFSLDILSCAYLKASFLIVVVCIPPVIHSLFSLLTFMELRVLPSNSHAALPENAGELTETLSSGICQSYNIGNDCSACNLLHLCLRCKQHGHPATDCKYGILRVSSGNVGSSVFQSCNTEFKAGHTQKFGLRPVSSLVNTPLHSAQAAIKAENPKRQQHSLWSTSSGPPMYWHVEFQTPRYRAYRDKCRQRGSKDEKWPDRVEEAFQMGMCQRCRDHYETC